MALPRKHNLEQLKKLRKITKGQDIGDIVKKGEKKSEGDMPNAFWIDNPFDRNIDTYESFIRKDNKLKTKKKVNENMDIDETTFVVFDNYLSTIGDIDGINPEEIVDDIIEKNKDKYDISELNYMREELLSLVTDYQMEQISESVANKGKGPGNTDFFSNNFKQILNTQLSPSLLQIGKFVKVGKIEGIIDSVDNNYIYVSNSDGVTKISYKKFMKELSLKESIDSQSGLPSEFWMTEDFGDDYFDDDDYFDNHLLMPKQNSDNDYYPKRKRERERYLEREVEVLEPESEEEIFEPEIQIDEEDPEIQVQDIMDIQDGRGKGMPRRKKGKPGIRRIGPTPNPNRQSSPGNPTEFPYYNPSNMPETIRYNRGTEDNPMGLSSRSNENIYIDEDKNKIPCNDCGQMVTNNYKSKIAHIYNKHFYKPKMDGSIPVKVESGKPVSWPSGGKIEQKLVDRYFPS